MAMFEKHEYHHLAAILDLFESLQLAKCRILWALSANDIFPTNSLGIMKEQSQLAP